MSSNLAMPKKIKKARKNRKIDPTELVSIPVIAKAFGYHPNHVSRLAKDGSIKPWRVGKAWVTDT